MILLSFVINQLELAIWKARERNGEMQPPENRQKLQ